MKSLSVFFAGALCFNVFFTVAPTLSAHSQQSYKQKYLAQGWQSLSPDDKRARMAKFMQNRAARGQGENEQQSSSATASSYNLKANLSYGSEPLQKMDVYSPKQPSGPAPILFFVHGGGWSRGDKASRDNSHKGQNYPANGVVFISVNYRLAPQVIHPKQIEDIADAFAWVKNHASEFGGDPDRIYIMGHSAGAQLVDLLGTNERFLAAKGLSLSDIKGVVSLDTASLDLNKRINDGSMEGGMVGEMITTAFGSNPKELADASPTSNIKAGEKYPPFLMFCGAMRKTCVAQHKVFAEQMQKVGGHAEVREVNLSHRDINLQSGQTESEIFKAVLAMITAQK